MHPANSSARTSARIVCIRGADPIFSEKESMHKWEEFLLNQLYIYELTGDNEEVDFSIIAIDGILRKIREKKTLPDYLAHSLDIAVSLRKADIVYLIEYTCCAERRNSFRVRGKSPSSSTEASDIAISLQATTQKIGNWFKQHKRFASHKPLKIVRCIAEIEPSDDYRFRKVIRFVTFEYFGQGFGLGKRACRDIVEFAW
jgi:hypothetical protein